VPNHLWFFTVVAAFVVGCADDPRVRLDVLLQTDHRPGIDFVEVRTTLLERDVEERSETTDVRTVSSFLAPRDATRFEGLPPAVAREVVVELLRGDGSVLESGQTTARSQRTNQVLITVCLQCRCPEGDPSCQVCPPGQRCDCGQELCVPDTCAEDDDSCAPGCRSDEECRASELECVDAVCREGACLRAPVDALCATSEVCDVSDGTCIPDPRPDRPDAGAMDGGLEDAGSDAVVDGGAVCTPRAARTIASAAYAVAALGPEGVVLLRQQTDGEVGFNWLDDEGGFVRTNTYPQAEDGQPLAITYQPSLGRIVGLQQSGTSVTCVAIQEVDGAPMGRRTQSFLNPVVAPTSERLVIGHQIASAFYVGGFDFDCGSRALNLLSAGSPPISTGRFYRQVSPTADGAALATWTDTDQEGIYLRRLRPSGDPATLPAYLDAGTRVGFAREALTLDGVVALLWYAPVPPRTFLSLLDDTSNMWSPPVELGLDLAIDGESLAAAPTAGGDIRLVYVAGGGLRTAVVSATGILREPVATIAGTDGSTYYRPQLLSRGAETVLLAVIDDRLVFATLCP